MGSCVTAGRTAVFEIDVEKELWRGCSSGRFKLTRFASKPAVAHHRLCRQGDHGQRRDRNSHDCDCSGRIKWGAVERDSKRMKGGGIVGGKGCCHKKTWKQTAPATRAPSRQDTSCASGPGVSVSVAQGGDWPGRGGCATSSLRPPRLDAAVAVQSVLAHEIRRCDGIEHICTLVLPHCLASGKSLSSCDGPPDRPQVRLWKQHTPSSRQLHC